MPIDKTCDRCGKAFRVKPRDGAQRFCTRACKITYEAEFGRANARVDVVTLSCRHCGKPFTHKPATIRAHEKRFGHPPRYCSRECGYAGRMADAEARNEFTCIHCGKTMPSGRKASGYIRKSRRLCSTECRSAFRRIKWRERHPNQQITKSNERHGRGYIYLCIPGTGTEPSRQILEHRYVMEQRLGRRLRPEETVHHKNGVRDDNREENLELFSSRHGPGQRVSDKIAFAIDMLRLYPEFALAAGVKLIDVDHVDHVTPPSAAHGLQPSPSG